MSLSHSRAAPAAEKKEKTNIPLSLLIVPTRLLDRPKQISIAYIETSAYEKEHAASRKTLHRLIVQRQIEQTNKYECGLE